MLPPASLKPNLLCLGAALGLSTLALVCWKQDSRGYFGKRTPGQGHLRAQPSCRGDLCPLPCPALRVHLSFLPFPWEQSAQSIPGYAQELTPHSCVPAEDHR